MKHPISYKFLLFEIFYIFVCFSMANVFSSWYVTTGVLSLLSLFCVHVYNRKVNVNYWSKRNIPHIKPLQLLVAVFFGKIFENAQEFFTTIHLKNRDKKIIGMWSFLVPGVVVTDISLIKRILVDDFNYFQDRGFKINEEMDPLAGHLFFSSGMKWRNLRVKLSPAFSSGKMKMIFPGMVKCGEELRRYMKNPSERREHAVVKDLLARFITDVIASCAFGLEENAPKSQFQRYGERSVTCTLRDILFSTPAILFPKITKKFKIRLISEDVSNYFLKLVSDTIQHREKTQTVRNDFLQLLIQLVRAGKIEDVEGMPVDQLEDGEIVEKFSLREAAAQCFAFFTVGFQTSLAAMIFALYELALNPDIQARVQYEIDAMLTSSDGEMTYEKVLGLEYLDMVVHETLRKYPPYANIQRTSVNDYYIPEINATLEKGTVVCISVSGVHRDPDIYPEPDKFDPERFGQEEKSKRGPCTFLAFGSGPRNCIGSKFGLMQVKIGLISVLRDYNVMKTKNTPIPVAYTNNSFVLTPSDNLNLVFTSRYGFTIV